MTFRARLVLMTTGAVLVVVLVGAVATYVVAYESLVGSLDVTLEQDARTLTAGNAVGNAPPSEHSAAVTPSSSYQIDAKILVPGNIASLALGPDVGPVKPGAFCR